MLPDESIERVLLHTYISVSINFLPKCIPLKKLILLFCLIELSLLNELYPGSAIDLLSDELSFPDDDLVN
jgi:hypothetical protein